MHDLGGCTKRLGEDGRGSKDAGGVGGWTPGVRAEVLRPG